MFEDLLRIKFKMGRRMELCEKLKGHILLHLTRFLPYRRRETLRFTIVNRIYSGKNV